MEWLFSNQAYLFSVPAIAGTAYFLISLVLGELGGDLDADIDLDLDGGDTPTAEFRVLSLQTISAFAMGSGWTGITAYRVLDMSFTGATVVAIVCGIASAWLIVTLLRARRACRARATSRSTRRWGRPARCTSRSRPRARARGG